MHRGVVCAVGTILNLAVTNAESQAPVIFRETLSCAACIDILNTFKFEIEEGAEKLEMNFCPERISNMFLPARSTAQHKNTTFIQKQAATIPSSRIQVNLEGWRPKVKCDW